MIVPSKKEQPGVSDWSLGTLPCSAVGLDIYASLLKSIKDVTLLLGLITIDNPHVEVSRDDQILLKSQSHTDKPQSSYRYRGMKTFHFIFR